MHHLSRTSFLLAWEWAHTYVVALHNSESGKFFLCRRKAAVQTLNFLTYGMCTLHTIEGNEAIACLAPLEVSCLTCDTG